MVDVDGSISNGSIRNVRFDRQRPSLVEGLALPLLVELCLQICPVITAAKVSRRGIENDGNELAAFFASSYPFRHATQKRGHYGGTTWPLRPVPTAV